MNNPHIVVHFCKSTFTTLDYNPDNSYKAGPDPDFYDHLAGAGDWYRDHGLYMEGMVMDISYGGTNDAFISYNWIVKQSMNDLQGHNVGREKAFNASFMSAITVLSLPLGGLGEVMGAGEAAVSSSSNLWKVGPYNEIRGLEEFLDAHHVGQKAIMQKLIPGYNWRTAPSILVPKQGHTIGSGVLSRSTTGISSVRQLIARDIMELRRVYVGIHNSALQELIQLNKAMYPSFFVK